MSSHVPPAVTSDRQELVEDVRAAGPVIGAAAEVPSLVHPSGRIDQTTVAFDVFAKLLGGEGVHEALYSLLRRTNYRFIAIFRFKDGKATSAGKRHRHEDGAAEVEQPEDGRQPQNPECQLRNRRVALSRGLCGRRRFHRGGGYRRRGRWRHDGRLECLRAADRRRQPLWGARHDRSRSLVPRGPDPLCGSGKKQYGG